MDAVPVIARGHNVASFAPPVAEAVRPLLAAVTGRRLLVLAPDAERAVPVAGALEPVLTARGARVIAVTGLVRGARLLAGAPDVACLGAADALALLRQSALRPAEFRAVALLWPEQLDEEGRAALEAVMAECDRDAQRIVLTHVPGPPLADLLERYAFKAVTFGFPPAEKPQGWKAPGPVGAARYVVARAGQYADTRRRVLDVLAPDADEAVAIAPCPESREAAEALVHAASAQALVIVAEPHQLGWLRSLFHPLSPLALTTTADQLERKADVVRERLARVADTEDLAKELFLLAPLLARYDAAVVAAAALRVAGSLMSAPAATAAAPTAGAAAGSGGHGGPSGATAKLWVGIGKKDNVRPGDLVGALANEAKVPADAIGKIEVRDLFCLVEIQADYGERAARGLTGLTVKGRRLVARVDKGPGAAARPPRRA